MERSRRDAAVYARQRLLEHSKELLGSNFLDLNEQLPPTDDGKDDDEIDTNGKNAHRVLDNDNVDTVERRGKHQISQTDLNTSHLTHAETGAKGDHEGKEDSDPTQQNSKLSISSSSNIKGHLTRSKAKSTFDIGRQVLDEIRKRRFYRNCTVNDQAESNLSSSSSSSSLLLSASHSQSSKNGGKKKKVKNSGLPSEFSVLPTCPICDSVLVGDSEAVNMHVDRCLMNSNDSNGDFSAVESNATVSMNGEQSVGEDAFETYTWAGQTRVRVTSMLAREQGPIQMSFSTASNSSSASKLQSAAKMGSLADNNNVSSIKNDKPSETPSSDMLQLNPSKRARMEDEEIEIVEDETDQYGVAQFKEEDLNQAHISRLASLPKYAEPDDSPTSAPAGSASITNLDQALDLVLQHHASGTNPYSAIIESLKSKIRDMQEQLNGSSATNIPKCLICMEFYKKPVVSVECWHVHCETCWLATLSAKKVCPQCNVITTLSHLRRIYL